MCYTSINIDKIFKKSPVKASSFESSSRRRLLSGGDIGRGHRTRSVPGTGSPGDQCQVSAWYGKPRGLVSIK